jgi:hypothetical protein
MSESHGDLIFDVLLLDGLQIRLDPLIWFALQVK